MNEKKIVTVEHTFTRCKCKKTSLCDPNKDSFEKALDRSVSFLYDTYNSIEDSDEQIKFLFSEIFYLISDKIINTSHQHQQGKFIDDNTHN